MSDDGRFLKFIGAFTDVAIAASITPVSMDLGGLSAVFTAEDIEQRLKLIAGKMSQEDGIEARRLLDLFHRARTRTADSDLEDGD
jgi:hypothetical protein